MCRSSNTGGDTGHLFRLRVPVLLALPIPVSAAVNCNRRCAATQSAVAAGTGRLRHTTTAVTATHCHHKTMLAPPRRQNGAARHCRHCWAPASPLALRRWLLLARAATAAAPVGQRCPPPSAERATPPPDRRPRRPTVVATARKVQRSAPAGTARHQMSTAGAGDKCPLRRQRLSTRMAGVPAAPP